MSGWIRNRKRTDGYPEGLEGKTIEARHRDGEVFTGVVGVHNYLQPESFNTGDKADGDVMAYRIIEDEPALAKKTPYEQLCEKHGVGLDAEWVTIKDDYPGIDAGMIATIQEDDGTDEPRFKVNNEHGNLFIPIRALRPRIKEKRPEDIAPKLWNAYKDVLNDEALAALRDVICNQWDVVGFLDASDVNTAFSWARSTQGENFWIDVHAGKYNKPQSALEMQNDEVGIPEPVNEVVFNVDMPEIMANHASIDMPKTKYHKPCKGTVIDVYDVLVAFNVTCPAMAHAIKKMLMAGQRGAKDSVTDKEEAILSIKRSIELERGE